MKNEKSTLSKPAKQCVWISPDFFEVDLKPKGWPDDPDLRSGVDWLLSFVKPEDLEAAQILGIAAFEPYVYGSIAPPSVRRSRSIEIRELENWLE